MPGAKFLEGEKINLRTIEEEDLDFLSSVNLPEIRENIVSVRTPQNMEKTREFFEEQICGEGSVNLLICVEEDPKGIISLIEEGKVSKIHRIGLWLHPDSHRKGYGTEACELMIKYGFNQLNAHKIFYRAHGSNKPSQNLAEKLGFEKEAVLKDHVYTQGEYKDLVWYRLLREEWEE